MVARILVAASVILMALAGRGSAGVGDPTLQTDHPHYAGEGAFQTVGQCVRQATAGRTTDQERAIALYLWILSHQYHLASPQECCLPGIKPDTSRSNDELIVADAERARFSYGYALCGTVHAWNEVYWRALGMPARRRAFPGHTNSEIFYGDAWHAFDTDMAGLVFRKDGIVAGYDDLSRDPTLVNQDHSPLPRYPFAWPADFRTMADGWKQVAQGGSWYKMYNSAYAAHPGIVALRSGETFTRYFDRDHFGGPAGRRFWHHQRGGPSRDWTFVNMGSPEHTGAKSNSRGNASYCNGEFVYRPNLSADAYREGVVEETANLASGPASPRLHSRDGAAATVTFHHFAPYVIAGCPADGADPMTGPATGGLIVAGEAVGTVSLEVSADQGQTWRPVGDVSGSFTKDLTDDVKGRYGWQVRCRWQDKAGLDALTFTTVTQVAQAIYPRLKPGGCEVVYRAASRAVVPVLPNFGATEEVAVRYEEPALRSANVSYKGRGPKSRLAYLVQGNKPGMVGFRVAAPAPLLAVTAAARYNVRVPPPADCDYRLEMSTDAGRTWKLMARSDIPADNEYSSGWIYGAADVSADRPRTALVRVQLYQGGYQVGLMAADLYGIYETPLPQPVTLTYAWKEAGQVKTHIEQLPAGTQERKVHVPTAANIEDVFVRLEAP